MSCKDCKHWYNEPPDTPAGVCLKFEPTVRNANMFQCMEFERAGVGFELDDVFKHLSRGASSLPY